MKPAALFFIGVTCLLLLSLQPSPFLSFLLFFAAIFCLLAGTAFAVAPVHLKQVQIPRPTAEATVPLFEELPDVPRCARDAHATIDETQFEYLAAAVVMARDQLHFEKRMGGSGDRGVDVRLRNHYGLLVLLQAKQYDPDRTVPSSMIRDFIGTLMTHDAVYGYFVTTARLTRDGRSDIARSPRKIHVLEGWQLDVLLQNRHREIALCLKEIHQKEHLDAAPSA